MKLSLHHWLIVVALAIGVHALAFAIMRSDETCQIERASGPVISIAGSLSDFASDVEPVVQNQAEAVEAEEQKPKVEPEETAKKPDEEKPVPAVVPEIKPKKPKPKKVEQKERQKEKTKANRGRNGTAGRRGGGGGTRQTEYAGTAAMTNFKGRVRARIASRAHSAQGRGTVVVRFILTASGSARSVRVIRSSNSALNSPALRAVNGGFPPIPPGLPRSITFTVPIAFQ
jgi:TonB family protein